MRIDDPVWLSAHLFYSGNLHLLLKNLVFPFIKEWDQSPVLQRYFFIRYGEGGKHIRLRLQTMPHWQNTVKAKLEVISEQFFSEIPVTEDATRTTSSPASGTLRYVEYIPEYNRYGGESVMRGAEMQFEASSSFVLSAIACSENWNTQGAFILAIKMHLVFWMAQGFTQDQMKLVCERFIDDWLPVLFIPGKPAAAERSRYLHLFHEKARAMSASLIAAIRECHTAFMLLQFDDDLLWSFYRQNKAVYSHYAHFSFEVYAGICTSFMHMTHNRLGIANGDEAWLVYLLQYGLSYE